MKAYFCWRCNKKMPFLEEDEWQQISPLLEGIPEALKEYRKKHNCDLETARRNCESKLRAKFKELTGMPGILYETIYHHRLKEWGQECPECGYLLRTPQAKFCANCGWKHIHKFMILFLIAASDMNDKRKDLFPKIAKQLNVPVQELFYIWMSPLHSETKRLGIIKNTNWKYWFHGFDCDLWHTADERFLCVSFSPKGRIDAFKMEDVSSYVFTSKSPWPEYNELKEFLFEGGESYELAIRTEREVFSWYDFKRSFFIPSPNDAKIFHLMEELEGHKFIERSDPELYRLKEENNRAVFIPKRLFMKCWKKLPQNQRSEPGMRKIYEEHKNSKIFSRLRAKYKFKRLWKTMTKRERIDTFLSDRWIISTKGKDQIKAYRA